MAFKLPENVQETTTTAGTGDLILGGAVADAFTFTSQLDAGDTTLYVVSDGTDLEAGLCIFQTSPSTKIQRSTVYFSTNSGAKVNWPSSGTRNVFCGLNGAVVQSFLEPGGNGLLIRSGTNEFEYRTLQQEYGLIITDPGGVNDDPSFRISQEFLDRVAYLETQHGNPGETQVYWTVNVLNNTLTFPINVVNYTGTAWAMTRDTTNPPSYPGDFTQGHWSDDPNKTLLSSTPETWRFYQWESVGGVTEILDFNVISGITVTLNDTRPPAWATDSFSVALNSTNPESAVDCTLSVPPIDPTPGFGLASTWGIYKAVDDLPVVTGIASATLTVTVVDLIPESVFAAYAKWDDVASPPNEGISNSASVMLAASDGGTLNFTASTFEAVENAGPIAVTITRSGSTANAVDVDVTTIENVPLSAEDGVDYTGVTDLTVSFGIGDTIKTVNTTGIAINDGGGSAYNTQFQIYMVPGSATNSAEIGNTDAALCNIMSSASGVTGWQQSTSGDNWLVLEAENADTNNASSSPDPWTGESWSLVSPADGPSNSAYESSAGLHDHGTGSTMQEGCPYLNWTVIWSSTATMYAWVRARTVGSTGADNVHLNTDNSDNNATSEAGLLGFAVAKSPPAHYWSWYNVNGSSSVRSFSATAGAGSVQACMQNQGFFLDKIAFTTSSTADPNTLGDPGFTPSIDGNYGPTESTEGTGDIPNLNWVTVPGIPTGGTALAASRYQPFDGSTMALTSDSIIATYNDVGNISITSGQVTQNGNPITGAYSVAYKTIPGVGPVGQVIFRPSGPLTKGATYLPVLKGVLLDSTGTLRSFDTTGWDFQVIDPTDTNVHVYEDFNQYSDGHLYTLANLQDNFNVGLLGYLNSVPHGYDTDTARMQIVTWDPSGQANMGNVLRCLHPAGTTVSDSMSFRADVPTQGGDSDYTEMYASCKMFIPTNHIWPDIHKFPPGLGTGTLLQMSHNFGVIPDPDGEVAFTAIGEVYGGPPSAWVTPKGSHATDFYDANVTQKPDWWSDSDQTHGWVSGSKPSDFSILPTGQWVHVERYVKMNTVPVEGTGTADGINRGWLDGVNKLNIEDHRWRIVSTMIIDGGWIYDHYNYNNVLGWAPLPNDQYIYYKDFVFSKVPVGNDDTF